MSKNDSLRAELALTESDRAEAINFIEHFMHVAFECKPPPTTGIIFVARMEGIIVGSIVLAGTDGNMPFAIESHYTFESGSAPFPFVRAYIVQGGRWINSRKDMPAVSSLLLQTAFKLAYDFGKRYMLIEAKPYSVKHLAQLGVVCFPVEGALLLKDRAHELVGDGGMKYFTEPPLPTLYMLELLPSLNALARLNI